MKSIGDTLKSVREGHGLSIDQVVHETNISHILLVALEEENFDVFSAEAYLIGFLRNYADFLGLDPDKIIGQYKNYKLNEEPTPMEELLGPPRGAVARKVISRIIILLVFAVGGVFGVRKLIVLFNEFRQQRLVEAEMGVVPNREIRPSLPHWEGEVFPGDILILEDTQEDLILTVSNAEDRFKLDAGSTGQWSMLLGEEIYFQGEDGRSRWRIYLKDINRPGNGAILEIQQLPAQLSDDYSLAEEVGIEPPSGVLERRREARVILGSSTPDHYTMNIVFRSFCLFRYRIDNHDSLESAFADGDNIQLDVERTVTIWASNAGAFDATIGGEKVRFGRRGEVAVRLLRWVLDEDGGNYNLTVFPLY